jgi:hypothetical protein
MLGTYVSMALILGASLVVGQAVFCACGHRERSALSPAVGLALLCAVAWLAADLASSAWVGLGAMLAVTSLSGVLLRFKPPEGELDGAVQAALGVVVLGSLPFLVEMRFGILGTSLNPDMSQHLFATDRLATGGEERLISEGYPLGPHALVASVEKLGPSFVHGFGGLSLAALVAATLAPFALLSHFTRPRRVLAALMVGVAYLAASYFTQGAFKETMQALFLLAFAVGLAQMAVEGVGEVSPRQAESSAGTVPAHNRLRALPLAVLAVGSLYVYSFPGLAWLAGTLGVFVVAEIVRARGLRVIRGAIVPTSIAVVAVLIAAAPEIPRMLDFASFETFDPEGAGLGNLFNAISPIEALGIWPSGDFRIEPGDGFAPALVFYVGGAVAAAALAVGTVRALRWGETALVAAVVAGAVLFGYALVSGTPYQEAKALAIVAPVVMLVAIRGCLEATPALGTLRNASGRALAFPALTAAFVVGAAGSSALALINGPVGPAHWTPAVLEYSEEIGEGPVLAVLDDEFADENGRDLITWELRGREVCVLSESEVAPETVSERAFTGVVVIGELDAPLPVVGRLSKIGEEEAGGLEYVGFEGELAGSDPDCPFVADGDRAEPG